jgi:hypothetical protein
VIAWALARPGLAAGGALVLALMAALAVQQVRLSVERGRVETAVAERDVARMAAAECSAATEALEAAAAKTAQDARRAIAKAKAASATRAPAIEALAKAEAAPAPASGVALTCDDAVARIRDALGS